MTVTDHRAPADPEHVALMARIDEFAAKVLQLPGESGAWGAGISIPTVLRTAVESASVNLAVWAGRDGGHADASVRQAANDAMTGIDAALAELHKIRADLVGEMRRYDDETARRVDALLAERRAGDAS